MKNCLWYEDCPFHEECGLCSAYSGEENEEYLSRENFYKDWFNYLERDTKE